MSELWRRLRALLGRTKLDRELQEEMEFHRALLAEENPEDARRQFGNATLLRETSREVWGWGWLERLAQDARYALRLLRRNPGFTVVAVLTFALGVGVATGIFSVVDALLLRPLPFSDSDRLVSLYYRTAEGQVFNSMSFPSYAYFRDRSDFLTAMAAYDDVTASLRTPDGIERIPGEIVSGNYLRLLGVQPALGRDFLPEEDRVPGANPVVVLGYGLWQRRFSGDPAVIGRTVVLNDAVFTVIGVAPRGFQGFALDRPAPPEFWAPLTMYAALIPPFAGLDLERRWTTEWLASVGRLKPGVTLAQAQARAADLTARLKREYWDRIWNFEPRTGVLYRLNDTRFSPSRRGLVVNFLALLLVVAALVLLISCFNVASLLLARATRRTREIAVRLSLGAGRGRVLGQLLTESLLLSLLGGAVGLVVALWTSAFLGSFRQPFKTPLLLETRLDWRLLLVSAVVSMVAGVLFGLTPMRMASQLDLTSALKVEAASAVSKIRGTRLRHWLIAGQVAICVVLLAGAGLFLRTLLNAQAADVTADPGNVLLFHKSVRGGGYAEARGKVLYPELVERMKRIPAVTSAALVFIVPLGGLRGGTDVFIAPPSRPANPLRTQVDFNVVSPDYFRTVGIPLLRGRPFTAGDREGAPGVAVVNEEWARSFWPGQDPLGKRFQLSQPPREVEVVGVVRDGPFRSYRASVKPCFYVPFAQEYRGQMSLELRTAVDPRPLLPTIRREIASVNKEFAEIEVLTLKSHRDAGLAQERLTAALLSAMGVLALALAAVGVYGVASFSTAQRTREIGLRIAVGAGAGDVLLLVFKDGLRPVLAGLAIGIAAALALTPLVSSLVFGISPADPLTFLAVAVVLAAVALVACYVPARRATRIDPMEALRYE